MPLTPVWRATVLWWCCRWKKSTKFVSVPGCRRMIFNGGSILFAPTFLPHKEVIMTTTIKDPVCHMEVPAASFATEYAGGHYAFCSAQCKERFLANPHLYVGFPGNKAPAQEGKE